MSDSDITALFRSYIDSASSERKEQTKAFAAALDRQQKANSADLEGLRKTVVFFGALLLLGVLSLSGVQVYYGARPASLTVASTASTTTRGAGVMSAQAAEPLPAVPGGAVEAP